MTTVYGYRPGRSLKNIDPQVLGLELERIEREKGAITPEIVVNEARDPANPLHAGFEWDDNAAAELYRLSQARRIVVSVRSLNSPTNGAAVPYYVSVKTPDRGRVYKPTLEVMNDAELSARVLAEVQAFVESIERRYSAFKEVQGLLANLRKAVG